MEPYVLTLLVTLEQEDAIQKLFGRQGWKYEKLDKSKITEYGMKNAQDCRIEPVVKSAPYNAAEDSVGGGGGDNEADANSEVAVDIRTVEQEGIKVKSEQDSANGNADKIDDEEVEVNEEDADDDDVGDEELDSESKEEQQNKARSKKCNKTKNNIRKTGRQHKRESSVKPNVRMKKARLSSAKAVGQDSEDEEDGVKEECGAENESDGEFYRLLETLPEIEHYTKVLTLDKDTLNSESDTCCLPGDVGDDGYSPSFSAYFCSDCGYVFPEPKYYTGHKRNGKCMFPCQVCNELYSFRNFSQYQKHLKIHREEEDKAMEDEDEAEFFKEQDKRYSCDRCPRSYMSHSNLRRHKHVHESWFKCHCGAKFNSKEYLGYHKRGAHGEGFKCSLCPKSPRFKTRTSLNSHLNKEHGSKYQCDVCGKKFGQQHHLKDHMLVHDATQAHCVCNQCGRTFNHLRSLTRHVKTNACVGKKRGRKAKVIHDEMCNVCGKLFPSLRALKQHLQMHSSAPAHKCDSCGQVFQFVQSYIRHRKHMSCERRPVKSNTGAKSGARENKVYWGQSEGADAKSKNVVFVELDGNNKRENAENDSDDSTNYFEITALAMKENAIDNSFRENTDKSGKAVDERCYVLGIEHDSEGNVITANTGMGLLADICKSSGILVNSCESTGSVQTAVQNTSGAQSASWGEFHGEGSFTEGYNMNRTSDFVRGCIAMVQTGGAVTVKKYDGTEHSSSEQLVSPYVSDKISGSDATLPKEGENQKNYGRSEMLKDSFTQPGVVPNTSIYSGQNILVRNNDGSRIGILPPHDGEQSMNSGVSFTAEAGSCGSELQSSMASSGTGTMFTEDVSHRVTVVQTVEETNKNNGIDLHQNRNPVTYTSVVQQFPHEQGAASKECQNKLVAHTTGVKGEHSFRQTVLPVGDNTDNTHHLRDDMDGNDRVTSVTKAGDGDFPVADSSTARPAEQADTGQVNVYVENGALSIDHTYDSGPYEVIIVEYPDLSSQSQ